MRLLVAHPGATWSVHDVWAGLVPALQRAGAEIVHYALDRRLEMAGSWLNWCWQRSSKKADKPGQADTVYHASVGILERALRHDVDWVLIVSAMWFHPDLFVLLRRAGIRVAVLFTESPYEDEGQLKYAAHVDACWVNERSSVGKFREVCANSYYWQHAIDPAKHNPAASQDGEGEVPAHDVVFVGTGWKERCDLLSAVDWSGIDLGLYGTWSLLGSRNRLRKCLRGGIVPNAMTARLYRRAKIGLNLHRRSIVYDMAEQVQGQPESMNPRGYELGACGLFHLSDDRPEVREVYDHLVPTFSTPAELESLIRRYLADDAGRRQIAEQLPGCLAGHTFDARAREMLATLEGLCPRPRAS